MFIRHVIEENEKSYLSSRAKLSINSRGRVRHEKESNIRTAFMRDRDRILHSEAFRRLKHKTQVFFISLNDLYRTRLTHTLEVSGIARTIARGLSLNEDLTEAISLGHDLGHPPFGHVGESAINEIYSKGFRHNIQSLRIVDRLEKKGKGLNLTYEVRDGILKHSKSMGDMLAKRDKDRAITLEGQIVRIADRISYLNHDIDDSVRAGILKNSDIPKSVVKVLGDSYSKRINTMVENVIEASKNSEYITMSSIILGESEKLKDYLYNRVYTHEAVLEESIKAKKVITDLYSFFLTNPDIIMKKTDFINYKTISLESRVVDYISMMTDSFAIRCYEKYFMPKKWFKLGY